MPDTSLSDPLYTPEFSPGSRFFIWKRNTRVSVGALTNVVIHPYGSRSAYRSGYELIRTHSYPTQRVLQDQLHPRYDRQWQEVTREGFDLVMRGTLSTFCDEAETLRPYFVERAGTHAAPSLFKTNHRIGAPKNKLP